MTRDDELPVYSPDAFPDRRERTDVTVYGVLLAAGASTRYGSTNKLLVPLEGRPLVRHAAETLVGSTVDGVTVVVGHESDRVEAALADLDVDVRENEDFAEGLSTSVRAGVEVADERNADAILLALGDMPWVDQSTIETLVDAYVRGVGDAVAAAYRGRRGNPVLFDARFFDVLAAEAGDVGGRRLLTRSHGAIAIETDDPGVVRDVDRRSDVEDAD